MFQLIRSEDSTVRPVCALAALVAVLAGRSVLLSAPAGPPYTVVTGGQRHPLAVTILASGAEAIRLDDLGPIFGLLLSEDIATRSLTVSRGDKSILLTPDQPLVSVNGRIVMLSAPVVREGGHWLVPTDFLNQALAGIDPRRIEVRRSARLVLVGEVRAPRVALRHFAEADHDRLVFEVPDKVPYTVTQQAGHITLAFQSDAIDVSMPATIPDDGVLSGVRVADPRGTLEIALGKRYQTFRALEADGPHRIVIDLFAEPARPANPATPSTPAAPPAPPIPGPAATGPRTIVLDPGHGGEETGAHGPTGLLEKEVTLSIARRLKALLESRADARVLLTREGDQNIALDDRAAMANNNKADLFISIHANASLRPTTHGSEVYFLSPGAADAEAQRAASSENAGAAPPGAPAAPGGSDLDLILWEMAQTRHLTESSALAEALEAELAARLSPTDRGVKQAPFRVLMGTNMPAVLVEVAFISNPEEEKRLTSDEFQNQIAQAIYAGVARYRAGPPRPSSPEPAPLGARPRTAPDAPPVRPPAANRLPRNASLRGSPVASRPRGRRPEDHARPAEAPATVGLWTIPHRAARKGI